MRNYHRYLFSLLGGCLLWAAWPTSPATFIIFFAFVPLLWVEANTESTRKFFGPLYVHMFVWNLLTTWWIYNASFVGAALAIVLNSLLLCVPWLVMRLVKKRFGFWAGYISLITFWVSFEFLHHRWELSWPWLTLGNVFAMKPEIVQWYAYTGTTGGTLWVLVSNVILFAILKRFQQQKRTPKYYGSLLLLLMIWIIPSIISRHLFTNEMEAITASSNIKGRNVVVVQPNVDPYDEKFVSGSVDTQIQRLISLSEQKIDSLTALVVWPETAVPIGVWEDGLQQNLNLLPVWNFLQRHPQLSLLTGIESYKSYGSNKKDATNTARFDRNGNDYYDVFNTAVMLKADGNAQFYHKAKLVPGVETLPSVLLFLGKWFEDFGGTSGTLGRDKNRTVFSDAEHYFMAAPIICYESIYSDYITEYVRKGANLLTIITNDGWWGNTQGYRQHMNYARLRAIETRRWVARSANTGISCFIDPAGIVHNPQPWEVQASIKMSIEPLQAQTFYVRHGDYLSRIINVASIIFLLLFAGTAVNNRFLKSGYGENG